MDLETVRMERESLIGGFRNCGPLLSAIGDENRQRILTALLETPGMRVEEIREHTDLSRPAVSHHLKVLKDTGVIVLRRKGTMNFYFPNSDPEVWEELNALTQRICEVTRDIDGNIDLEGFREALMDEYDRGNNQGQTLREELQ